MSEPSGAGAFRRHGGRMALFGGVGLFNTLTDFLVFAALVAGGFAPALANVAAFFVANAQSYAVNARVTFREQGAPAPLSFGGYARFAAAHLISLAVSTAIVLVLAEKLGPYAAKGVALIVTFAWNYAMTALFVFRPGPPSPGPGAGGEGPGRESA
ncbi:MAG: GtrA family protein [Amphiplicatus sp.]